MITISMVGSGRIWGEVLEEELKTEPDFLVSREPVRKPGQKEEEKRKTEEKRAKPDAVVIHGKDAENPEVWEWLKPYRKSVGIIFEEDPKKRPPEGLFSVTLVCAGEVYGRMLSEEIRGAVFKNRIYGGTFGSAKRVQRIRNLLDRAGIPRHQRGSFYLVDVLQVLLSHPGWINRLMRRVYPAVAEKYGVTAVSVERAIRYSLRTLWFKHPTEFVRELFPQSRYETEFPPNKEWFVSLLCLLEGEEERGEAVWKQI